MKTLRHQLLTACLLCGLLIPPHAHSQMLWDPLDGVPKLVNWFVKLNDQFEQIVVAEKRGQLLRKSDRMRKELYTLEADTKIILDNLTDKAPDAERVEYLLTLSTDLLRTVQRLSFAVREFGADLRVNDANDVEIALTIGLRVREGSLTYLRKSLEESKQGKWNADAVRRQIERGLSAIKEAQLSVTSFSQRLRAPKI